MKWFKCLRHSIHSFVFLVFAKKLFFAKSVLLSINFMSLTFIASWNERHKRYLVTKKVKQIWRQKLWSWKTGFISNTLTKEGQKLCYITSRWSWELLNKWRILLFLISVYKTNCDVALSRFFQLISFYLLGSKIVG